MSTQAVILVAGEGTRLRPLTYTRPKPLLKVGKKTILEHNLDQLNSLVSEVILVIGYKGDMIKEKIGNSYKGMKIKYVTQDTPLGTGDSAQRAISKLKDKFLLLNGDDIYYKEDLNNLLEKCPSILLQEVVAPEAFGQIVTEGEKVKELVEKPAKNVSNMVNTGAYFLDKSVLNLSLEKSERGEYEITDFIKHLISKNELYFALSQNWTPVSYAWHLLDANQLLLKELTRNIKGYREKNTTIKGKVFVEKGAIIKSGVYIEGPVYIAKNCEIGPNCYIRGSTSIGDGAHIGQSVEIKNSIIYPNSNVAHLSYVGDSIIGENNNLGAGTISANLRLDDKEIVTVVKQKEVNTNRRKFGVALGDEVKVGVNVSLMPGVLVSPYTHILPHSLVKKNIGEI